MPRSKRPVRYPTICFRIASLCESRTEGFSLQFDTQRAAIDTRQMLYSFSQACDHEATREHKLKHLTEARRWRDLYSAFGRWQLVIDPAYDKAVPYLLDLPATLHFQLRDALPKYTQLEDQLSDLERTLRPVEERADMAEVYRQLGLPPTDVPTPEDDA